MARLDKQFESEKVDWQTPDDVFVPLEAEFGFTLDAAASEDNSKCADYIGEAEDGLTTPWRGIVWCNPPYGRGLGAWARKAAAETFRGVTSVLLIPARTNTKWFHQYCLGYGEVRFIKGRPKFGGASEGLPWPLCVVVFRGKPAVS
jgi:site-specific DNA-methyltransferase (adenine-specific)|tara:strand:- start:48 stop:485 length:438 start_codon:yes stop_codon:yes gene_type:complete